MLFAHAAASFGAELDSSSLNAASLRRSANSNVVSILGSGMTGTYAKFAEDIRNVLEADGGNDLRVMPILGRSAGQNLIDLVFLRGADMGIVDQNALYYLKKRDPVLYAQIEQRVQYIAKVFDSELHVIASTSVSRLADLRGRKVNCQQPLSAASILCETLFEALSLPAEILHFEAEEALVKLRKGELDAVVRVGGAPIPGLAGIKSGEGLHLVPVGSANLSGKEFDKIRVLYAPALLKHETYPQLISEGEVVPTLASGAALAVCGWPEDTKRYAVLAKFVQVFFDNIDKFHGAPRHPKWRDVNLAAEIPGWKRFKPAREWLDARRPREPARVASARNTVALKAAFDKFVQDYLASRNMEALSYEERKVLLAQFMAWSEAQPGANER